MLIPNVSNIYGENTCISEPIVESNSQLNPFEFSTTFEGSDDSDTNAKMQITLQGNIEEKSPSVSVSTEKIVINRHYWDQRNASTSFVVKMGDSSVPLVTDITLSEFFISGKTASSVAHDQLSPHFNSIFTKDDQSCIVTITDNTTIETFGKYTGKLYIHGGNFETKTIDVEYKTQWHPGWLIIFTIIGVLISMSSGFLLLKVENEENDIKERKMKMKILNHINHHIEFFNTQLIGTEQQRNTMTAFNDDKRSLLLKNPMPKDEDKINIEKIPQSMLEDISKQYHNVFDTWYEYIKKGGCLPELKPLDFGEYKIPEKTIKNDDTLTDIISTLIKHKKTITAFSTVIATLISIPATLFAVSYFSGIPWIDAIMAGGVGFTVYRFKDIGKMLKGLL